MILLIVIGVLGACLPVIMKRWKAERQRLLLASQLRQSLQNMVHALRVGVSFMQALDYAAQEGEEPLVSHWRRLLQSIRVGQPLVDALRELSERVPLKEMGWFVAAVQITQSTGGSLADVLDQLSTTLQERESLRDKVSALTAQGKASGALLSALPFLVTGALFVIAPKMVAPMFTTLIGQMMLAGVLVFIVIGGVVIERIVSIRVD
jgi:tight adherence protein B